MKKILIAAVIGLAVLTASAGLRALVTVSKTVTTAGTPVRLSATNDYFTEIMIVSRTTNTGSIYIQTQSAAGLPRIVLTPGQTLSITMVQPGDFIDLYPIYVDSSVNLEVVDVFGTRRQ